jgi:hypothetical protein
MKHRRLQRKRLRRRFRRLIVLANIKIRCVDLLSPKLDEILRMLSVQPDPRKPKRPDGDAGSNWAHCHDCGRGAPKAKLIRHSKHCKK